MRVLDPLGRAVWSLRRLQEELHKSRETEASLRNLTGPMDDIHDTLGGSLVSAPLF